MPASLVLSALLAFGADGWRHGWGPGEVTAAAERGIQRIRGTPHLAYSFLRYCGLSLW